MLHLSYNLAASYFTSELESHGRSANPAVYGFGLGSPILGPNWAQASASASGSLSSEVHDFDPAPSPRPRLLLLLLLKIRLLLPLLLLYY